jgi:hypothetical protein
MYFTNFINNKQSVYSFYTEESANKCKMYLGKYKHTYGKYPPTIDNDTPVFKFETLPFEKREPLQNILNSELILLEEDDSFLKMECNVLNIGLIGINNFDYSFSPNEIKINFTACDLFTKDVFQYNHIEYKSNSSVNNRQINQSWYVLT